MLDGNILEAISPSSVEVPDYAKRWGDVSRIASILDGIEYDKRISPESIFFLKTEDNPEGKLVISLKCELCLERKQACNRERPACQRCRGKQPCEYRDSETGFTLLLRQGRRAILGKAKSRVQSSDAPTGTSITLFPGLRSTTSTAGRAYKPSNRVRDMENFDAPEPTDSKSRQRNLFKSSVKHVPYSKSGKLS